jgi:hypothetical protein
MVRVRVIAETFSTAGSRELVQQFSTLATRAEIATPFGEGTKIRSFCGFRLRP